MVRLNDTIIRRTQKRIIQVFKYSQKYFFLGHHPPFFLFFIYIHARFFPIRTFFSVFSDRDTFSGSCGFQGGFAYLEGFQAFGCCDHKGLVVEYGADEVTEFRASVLFSARD